jgi:signal transduction histidine kinase
MNLVASEEALRLDVADNGSGFDLDDLHEGMGLVNVRDRVEALGGVVSVSSDPGQGTIVSVEIPLDGEDEEREQTSTNLVAMAWLTR